MKSKRFRPFGHLVIHTSFVIRISSLILVLLASTTTMGQSPPVYLDPSQPVETRVQDLLGRMTVEEKIAIIHGDTKFSTAPIPRLGIPRRWMSDGPFGVREDISSDSWKAAGHTNDYSTGMPCGLALAATWNVQLAHDYGQVIGEEARVRGKQIMLGPAVNIQRTPLCGRNFEYFGEDPWLTSRIAVGYIQGEQAQGVSSCIKHFAANNQELDRNTIDVEMDERTLREIYLPAFRAAVREAGVLSVMGSYNQFRGQHCAQNDYLINTILKGEWGFKGILMSDWDAAHDTRQAALNGLDLEMGTDKPFDQYYLATPFLDALRQGQLAMSLLDEKARRNLRVMFLTHMFDPPTEAGSANTPAHQRTARAVAEEAIVLLKNQGNILPLDPARIKSIAVIGENAVRKFEHGGGSSEIKTMYEVTPLEGIVTRVGGLANVSFSVGYAQTPSTQPTTRRRSPELLTQVDKGTADRAVDAARHADVAIFIGGLNHVRNFDAEGEDRLDMKLPYGQDDLIKRVSSANPRTIVVLISGGAVEMDWLDRSAAVVQAWYPGMEGGNALARVLFGDVNPSGKLPCTFPRHLEDSPAHALHAYPGVNGVEKYEEGLLVGYRWFDAKKIEPLFPFGFGLSYTKFEYSNLKLAGGEGGSAVNVQCDIANRAGRDGAEVVQVYVQPTNPQLPRPPKELKGFAKVSVNAGQQQTVTIPLDLSAFAYYDPQLKGWIAQKDDYTILVGSSSRDIRLQGKWSLPETIPVK
jgi:beta-glucosidase